MNQLCVPVPSAADTPQILQEVFTLCRIPWIHDFIFQSDPAADLSMLLAPVQKRHALAARILVNATETTSKYAHYFDFNKEILFYSIPAFSVGPITAGLCVEQCRSTPPSPQSLRCIRYVRDDTKGVFFLVAECPVLGVTEVDCLMHRSSTRRSRVRGKFDLQLLRNALSTARGLLHPTDVACALLYLNVSEERRRCPVCVGADTAECACVLPFLRPVHPLDFRFEGSNMQLYTGFYQGATVVRLCALGHSVVNATLQSGSVIQGETDAAVIGQLHRLALDDRLAKVRERPGGLDLATVVQGMGGVDNGGGDVGRDLHVPGALGNAVVNACGEAGRNAVVDVEGDAVVDIASDAVIDAAGDAACGAVCGAHVDVGGGAVVDIAGNSLCGLQGGGGIGVLSAGNMGCVDGGNAGDDDVADPQSSVSLDVGDGLSFGSGDLIDPGDMVGFETHLQSSVSMCAPSSVVPQIGDQLILTPQLQSQSEMPLQASNVYDVVDATQPRTQTQEQQESGAMSSISDENQQTVDDYNASMSGEMNEADDEHGGANDQVTMAGSREAPVETDRVEIRKQRNRASAAKSNRKRKQKNEKTQREVLVFTNRMIHLRAKERRLREENTRLKNALREKDSKIPVRQIQ